MADFKTYEHIVKWIGKGKRRTEGRKKRAFMFRMVEGSDVIIMSHATRKWEKHPDGSYGPVGWDLRDFAEIRPNDVLTFTRDAMEMRKIAVSMSSTFWKVLGLCWNREGMGRYSLFKYDEDNGKALYWQARHRSTKKYEYFKNMMWDFNAGVCFNPRPPILKTVDRDKRKTWVGDLKKFRRLFLTKVKLGIVQTIIDEKHDDGKRAYDGQELPDEILEAIKAGDVHTDLLARLVSYTRRQSYKREATNETVKRMLTSIINNNSIRYRQEYGVLRK